MYVTLSVCCTQQTTKLKYLPTNKHTLNSVTGNGHVKYDPPIGHEVSAASHIEFFLYFKWPIIVTLLRVQTNGQKLPDALYMFYDATHLLKLNCFVHVSYLFLFLQAIVSKLDVISWYMY